MPMIFGLIKTLAGKVLSAVSGFSLRTWAIIGAAIAVALLTWLAYSWAWDRGAQSQKEKDEAVIAKCQSEVLALRTAVTAQNEAVEAMEKDAAHNSAKSGKAASDALKASDAARKKAASHGVGPDAMNALMLEVIQ